MRSLSLAASTPRYTTRGRVAESRLFGAALPYLADPFAAEDRLRAVYGVEVEAILETGQHPTCARWLHLVRDGFGQVPAERIFLKLLEEAHTGGELTDENVDSDEPFVALVRALAGAGRWGEALEIVERWFMHLTHADIGSGFALVTAALGTSWVHYFAPGRTEDRLAQALFEADLARAFARQRPRTPGAAEAALVRAAKLFSCPLS